MYIYIYHFLAMRIQNVCPSATLLHPPFVSLSMQSHAQFAITLDEALYVYMYRLVFYLFYILLAKAFTLVLAKPQRLTVQTRTRNADAHATAYRIRTLDRTIAESR